jgi:hypothetical protein
MLANMQADVTSGRGKPKMQSVLSRQPHCNVDYVLVDEEDGGDDVLEMKNKDKDVK